MPTNRLALVTFCTVLLGGCAGSRGPAPPPYMADVDAAPATPFDASSVPDAVPRAEPRSRYGNPATYVVLGKQYRVMDDAAGFRERGLASWYGTRFHGRRTSSGEPYDMYQMTAAHKSLPIPSYVKVTNTRNGKSAVVRVNDRGPFHEGRIIDLSYAAALKLDVVGTGTAPVEIVVLDPADFSHNAAGSSQASERRETATVASAAAHVFIQLGAFTQPDNALDMKGRLERAGIRPIRIDEEAERQLFRVRVGPFVDAGLANETALKLVALGIADFRIVTE